MRWLTLCLAASALAPLPALAQTWQEYAYRDAGFTVQAPAKPVVTTGAYAAPAAPRRPRRSTRPGWTTSSTP
jgi:hypothetical protein